MNGKTFKIGTRGSPLALKQAELLKNAISPAHPDLAIEIIPIKSAADWKKQDGEKALCTQNGGKGQFAKEIEALILDGTIDCGVHSLKDMASTLPDGLVVDHYLPRADAGDAFICNNYSNLMDLPAGSVVGTCSPRRQAFILSKRPDLKVVPFRGNVATRLEKIKSGQVDATYLAMAGLERLGIKEDPMIYPVSIKDMLPACGQGIICMEHRVDDHETCNILKLAHDTHTGYCAIAEREVLRILDGSCHTPIAAYAVLENNELHLQAIVASLDGQEVYEEELQAACTSEDEAQKIGSIIGENIKSKLPEGFLDQ